MINNQDVINSILEAEKVIVGIGEEFDDSHYLIENPQYKNNKEILLNSEYRWLLPEYQNRNRIKKEDLMSSLTKLENILHEKDYFIIATSMNSSLNQIPWKENNIILPCGGSQYKQCCKKCNDKLLPVSKADRERMDLYLLDLERNNFEPDDNPLEDSVLGLCEDCGNKMVLNNIYATKYNESGYLNEWTQYTKWLQNTINKKVVLLELGVNLRFPSVIRWPFEKVAFYNQKAKFYRVNETLYQMNAELKDKGISIKKNAIDWLLEL